MSSACKGTCQRHRAPKGKRTYLGGGSRCTLCALFVEWEGVYCPCCGQKLRHKIRSRAIPMCAYKRI